jgi:NAD(P)-dependent dehydrogenase (short-subunit alcohol dehydrogenase family)
MPDGGAGHKQTEGDMPSGQRMAGKVVLVSGAGSRGCGIGNGRASAILCAREGARVAVVDIDGGAAEATADWCRVEGSQALVVLADVTREADCARAVDETVTALGALDVLVNVVGIIGAPQDAPDLDIAEWDAVMRLNLTSMVMMTKYAVPAMRASGRGGAIVNISSIGGLLGGAPLAYTTSKGAIVSMTRTMASHHARDGIRTNCVAPGMVYTPMVADGMSEAVREARRMGSPLKTEGTGWDVGYAVLFLASDEARWINGVVLPVDGGNTAVMHTPMPE